MSVTVDICGREPDWPSSIGMMIVAEAKSGAIVFAVLR